MRGSTLEQARGALQPREAVAIRASVARAVEAMHRLQLVHRDLKPSNILLERMMAVHDFRPTCDLVREQLERDRASTRQLDPPWNSRGHYAVGCGAFLLHDYTMALGYGGRNQALLRRSLVQQVQPGLN
jgi:hypothetical protein